MSLRLTSILLVGLARVLKRQADMLNTDCHSTRSSILSTPWITSDGSFNPLISAANTVASCESITLPVVSLASDFSGIDPDGFADATAERHALFGWSCSSTDTSNSMKYADTTGSRVDQTSTVAPHTVAWDSISFADTVVRRAEERQDNIDQISAALLYSDQHALATNAQLIRPGAYGDAGRYDNSVIHGNDHMDLFLELDNAADYGRDIHFSDDGNLHFISSSPPPIGDNGATVERLHANLEASGLRGFGIEDSHIVPLEGRVPLDMVSNNVSIPAAQAQHVFLELSAVETYGHRLEAVKNDLTRHWEDRSTDAFELVANEPEISERQHARKRPKVLRNRRQLESYIAEGRTYEDNVRTLWGDTCVWDSSAESNTAVLRRQTRHQIRRRVQKSSNMYANSCVQSLAKLFILPLPETATVDEQISGTGDHAGNYDDTGDEDVHGYIFDDDADLELEERRGELPGTTDQELDHLDLHLDIPWLNPEMFNPEQRRQSAAGRSVSIRTESSPDPARYGRQHSGSVRGTPNSHVPSLDPLSSEDGLEIRS
ncbi:hypothetical protein GGI05_004177, partial [Coemansia sp. RSA 2603]